jgi:hypothetical protein
MMIKLKKAKFSRIKKYIIMKKLIFNQANLKQKKMNLRKVKMIFQIKTKSNRKNKKMKKKVKAVVQRAVTHQPLLRNQVRVDAI